MQIPGYRVLHKIARGGMGTVYKAMQLSLQRPVALKVMRPELASQQDFTQRFLREGRIVASLTHPAIVTIFDLGLAADHHFIAFEYVDGGDLKERIRMGMRTRKALRIVRKIALGLYFAHRRGVVHSDVKPENILFRDGYPLLTDFGIAVHMGGGLSNRAVPLGSPYYMSPEQAMGQKLDGRTDIYSLGIVLQEMLTGQRPFAASSYDDLVRLHCNDPAPPLPPELGYLQPIIDRMIAKSPDRRFPSIAAFIRALEQIRDASRSSEETTFRKASRKLAETIITTARHQARQRSEEPVEALIPPVKETDAQ